MKKRFYLITAIMFLGCQISGTMGETNRNNPANQGPLNIYSPPGLFDLAKKWSDEFTLTNPEMKIKVSQENNLDEAKVIFNGIVITEDESLIIRNQAGWNMIIGRDIIVPIMNKQNPAREKIIREGITPQSLELMITNGERCYTANDKAVIKGVEKFMNSINLKEKGIETVREGELIAVLSREPNSIAFIRLNSIIKPDGQNLPENIEFVPIDKNGNGKVDYMEEIYDNVQAFKRGVWIGKYPKALSTRIYAFSKDKTVNGTQAYFLSWILSDGQKFLSDFGYNDLVPNEKQAQLSKIEPTPITHQDDGKPLSRVGWIVTILLLSGVIVLVWIVLAGMKQVRKEVKQKRTMGQITVFDEDTAVIPGGLFFDKTHTWTFMKKDGTIKVGIDDFLQHVTGRITRAELRKTGDKIRKGEHLVTLVQNGKQIDIYSPVSGTIQEQNRSLSENPYLINTSPYNEGWIYCIEPMNWPLEIQFLSMAGKYKSGLQNEFLRLKDFLITALKSREPEYALVLQDGGALRDNILEELGPEIWDDFQTNFIDAAMH